jgi:glyoxylase-like metal-dependent hydrolase (beta-lactamase superfamily II)
VALIHHHGEVIAIDSFMHGRQGITAVYYLDGPKPAIIEAAPASSLDHVLRGLEEAGVERLEWIVLTHIHLDHAGAAGHLAAHFPDTRVVVRSEGAPHLADPSRLWASAARLYPDMEERWGSMLPIPESRIEAVATDGPVADLGDGRVLEAVYAPGHAKHQMVLFERNSGDLFVGDAIGVYLPEAGAIRPATPPPEFDLELSLATIENLRRLSPTRVFPTHFGPVPNVEAAFDEGALRIRQWVGRAEEALGSGGGIGEVVKTFQEHARDDYAHLDADLLEKLEQTTSYALNAAGIVRYLQKRAEAARL